MKLILVIFIIIIDIIDNLLKVKNTMNEAFKFLNKIYIFCHFVYTIFFHLNIK